MRREKQESESERRGRVRRVLQRKKMDIKTYKSEIVDGEEEEEEAYKEDEN